MNLLNNLKRILMNNKLIEIELEKKCWTNKIHHLKNQDINDSSILEDDYFLDCLLSSQGCLIWSTDYMDYVETIKKELEI